MRARSTSFALALGVVTLTFLRPSLDAQRGAPGSPERTTAPPTGP